MHASMESLAAQPFSECALFDYRIQGCIKSRDGNEKLKQWLSENNKTNKWLCDLLGKGQPTVYRWVHGNHVPEPEFREAIADLTSQAVAFEDWYTEEQLRVANMFRSRGKLKKQMQKRDA